MASRRPSGPFDQLAEYFADHPRALLSLQIVPPLVFVFFFVFVGVLGDSVVPEILGGATDSSRTLIANLIDKAISGQQYPMAAAIASIILLMAIGLIWGWERAFGLKKIGEI